MMSKLFSNFSNKQHGETLIGVVIGTLILTFVVMSFLAYMANVNRFLFSYDHYGLMKELMNQNLIEIQTKSLASYPTPPVCMQRTYDLRGKKKTENNNAPCNPSLTDSTKVLIVIEILPQSSIAANFSQPGFMKLPSLSGSIYQFNIKGQIYDNETQSVKTLNLTYFKKEGS